MGGLSGSDIRPGTVDTKAISAELFPFEDFSMSPLDSTDPTLELRTPRRLIGEVTSRAKTPTGSSITIGTTDGYTHYYITTGASDFTVNLPAVASARGPLFFFKVDSGAGEIVVDPSGTETLTYSGGTATTLRVGLIGQFLAILPSSTTWMKIGGVTQPVALEPDLGDHSHVHNYQAYNADVADTNWHEVSLAGQAAPGARKALITYEVSGTSTYYVIFSEASGGTTRFKLDIPVANGYATGQFAINLSAMQSFWFQGQNAGLGTLTLTMNEYFL